MRSKKLLVAILVMLLVGVCFGEPQRWTYKAASNPKMLYRWMVEPKMPGDVWFDALYDVHWDKSAYALGFLDNAILGFGNTAAAPDIYMRWDATNLDMLTTGGQTVMTIGTDGILHAPTGLACDSITNHTDSHISWITKTAEITIGHPGETTTDLAYTSAANTTEQTLDVNSIFTVPAWGRVLSTEVICTEDVNNVDADGIMSFSVDAGHAGGGAQWIAAAVDVNEADNVATSATAGAPYIAPSSSIRHVYVNATPGSNWDETDAGEWVLFVTYIDLGAIKD